MSSPSAVHCDLDSDAITALRLYMPMDVLTWQLDVMAPSEQAAG